MAGGKMKLRAIGKIKFGFRFYLYSRAGYWHLEIEKMIRRPKNNGSGKISGSTKQARGIGSQPAASAENKAGDIPDLTMGELIDREQEAGNI
jgi:hypothetical protein